MNFAPGTLLKKSTKFEVIMVICLFRYYNTLVEKDAE